MSVSAFLGNDSFDLDFGVVTKVDEKSKPEPRCLEVILNLSPVLVGEFRYCFEFQDDFFVTDKIRLVF